MIVTCDICAWTPGQPAFELITETPLWRVVLPQNQCLLGRCVVALKRHCGDLADLRQDELSEWLGVVAALEAALRTAFGATMFKWSCYMNFAYRMTPPDPHIHWSPDQRYRQPVTI